MPVVAPVLAWGGAALGASLGVGTLVGSIGGAVIGGALGGGIGAEISGGDFATGALGGALGGFAGPLTGMLTEAGLGATAASVVARGALGGVGAAVTGGDVGKGVLGGAIGGFAPALNDMLGGVVGDTAAGMLTPALVGGAGAAVHGGDFLTGAAMGLAGGVGNTLTKNLFGSTSGSIFNGSNSDPSLSGTTAGLAAYDQATFGGVPYSGSNTMWDNIFSTDYSLGSGTIGSSYSANDWYSPTLSDTSYTDPYAWNPSYDLFSANSSGIGNVNNFWDQVGAYDPYAYDPYALYNANTQTPSLGTGANYMSMPVINWDTAMWNDIGMEPQPWLTGEGEWGNPVETWTPEQWTTFDSAVGDSGLSNTIKQLASQAAGTGIKQLLGGLFGGGGGSATPGINGMPTGGNSSLPSWLPWALGGLGVGAVLNGNSPQQSSISTVNTPYQPPWLDAAQQQMAGNILSTPTVAPFYTQPLAAGLTQNQSSGIGMADSVTGAWAPQFANAVNQANRTALTLPETDLNAYMNPYIAETLAPTLRGINQQFDTNQQQLDLTSASRGAFGGSRNTLMGGLNNENRARALSEATSKGYSDAYNYATSNALADRNALLGTANTLGNFAGNYQNMLGQDISQLMSTGGVQYGVNDALLQRQYQDYLTQLNYPISAMGGLSNALSSIMPRVYPNTSNVVNTGADPNMWLNALGATSTGVGILQQMGYFNNPAQTVTP